MKQTIVPIFVCVVLPVAITLIVAAVKMNRDKTISQVLLKALESPGQVDTDRLIQTMENGKKRKTRTSYQELTSRLLRGCIFTLVGIVLVVAEFMCGTAGCPEWSFFTLGGVLFAIGVSYLIVYAMSRRHVLAKSGLAEKRDPESVID